MKKRISAFLLIVLIPILFGCQRAETKKTKDIQQNTAPALYQNICVDISDTEGGFYALMADAKLEYYQNALVGVTVEDPTVLAFKVPDRYESGVGIIDGSCVIEIKKIINERLGSADVSKDTRELLTYLLQELENVYLVTSAST